MLHSLERGLPEPDLRTYVHAGDPHHITIGEEAFELKVGSVSFVDWMRRLLSCVSSTHEARVWDSAAGVAEPSALRHAGACTGMCVGMRVGMQAEPSALRHVGMHTHVHGRAWSMRLGVFVFAPAKLTSMAYVVMAYIVMAYTLMAPAKLTSWQLIHAIATNMSPLSTEVSP